MSAFDRMDQAAAEDRQASVMLTNADASLLNGLDGIGKMFATLRRDNSDSERDKRLAEVERMARDIAEEITDGWL